MNSSHSIMLCRMVSWGEKHSRWMDVDRWGASCEKEKPLFEWVVWEKVTMMEGGCVHAWYGTYNMDDIQ